ncbi:unnamed protein product, partial [Mesorhabditis belari]|uniref:C2H2-type domain-containing protein n=1 Tax=Mesorhabditis belari TaxID=2138241 RepID=A0AAF3FKA7_9BILA
MNLLYCCSKCDYENLQKHQIESHITSKHDGDAVLEDKISVAMIDELIAITKECFADIDEQLLKGWEEKNLQQLKAKNDDEVMQKTATPSGDSGLDEESLSDVEDRSIDDDEPPKKKVKSILKQVSFNSKEPAEEKQFEKQEDEDAKVKMMCLEKNCGKSLMIYNEKGSFLFKTLITHIATHIVSKRWRCSNCPFNTLIRGNFNSHNRNEHDMQAELVENLNTYHTQELLEKGIECFPSFESEIRQHCDDLKKDALEKSMKKKQEDFETPKMNGKKRGKATTPQSDTRAQKSTAEVKRIGRGRPPGKQNINRKRSKSAIAAPSTVKKREVNSALVRLVYSPPVQVDDQEMVSTEEKFLKAKEAHEPKTPTASPTKALEEVTQETPNAAEENDVFATPVGNGRGRGGKKKSIDFDVYKTPAAVIEEKEKITKMRSKLPSSPAGISRCQCCNEAVSLRGGNIQQCNYATDHALTHLDKIRYKCGQCEKPMPRRTSVTNHGKSCRKAFVVDELTKELLHEMTDEARKSFPSLVNLLDEWEQLMEEKLDEKEKKNKEDDDVVETPVQVLNEETAPILESVITNPQESTSTEPQKDPDDEPEILSNTQESTESMAQSSPQAADEVEEDLLKAPEYPSTSTLAKEPLALIFTTPVGKRDYRTSPHPSARLFAPFGPDLQISDKDVEVEYLKKQLQDKEMSLRVVERQTIDLKLKLDELTENSAQSFDHQLREKEESIQKLQDDLNEKRTAVTELKEDLKKAIEQKKAQKSHFNEKLKEANEKSDELQRNVDLLQNKNRLLMQECEEKDKNKKLTEEQFQQQLQEAKIRMVEMEKEAREAKENSQKWKEQVETMNEAIDNYKRSSEESLKRNEELSAEIEKVRSSNGAIELMRLEKQRLENELKEERNEKVKLLTRFGTVNNQLFEAKEEIAALNESLAQRS